MLPSLASRILPKVNWGDIVFVEVETVDESLAADDVFGTIEAVKTGERPVHANRRRSC